MILRVIAGVTGGTEPRHARGLIRAHVGRDRTSGALIAVSVWEDPQTAGSVPAEDLDDAAFFDVGSTWLEWSREEPTAFRLAIGRFTKPGSDLEMLAMLRERIPMLGDGVTESAVGRRIVGRAVEVLFFSAWARGPADRPLERSFWPDLALGYDEFSIRVCTPTRPVISRPAVTSGRG